jgi:hypothetical protein
MIALHIQPPTRKVEKRNNQGMAIDVVSQAVKKKMIPNNEP